MSQNRSKQASDSLPSPDEEYNRRENFGKSTTKAQCEIFYFGGDLHSVLINKCISSSFFFFYFMIIYRCKRQFILENSKPMHLNLMYKRLLLFKKCFFIRVLVLYFFCFFICFSFLFCTFFLSFLI